ncbi:MAG: pseudouridine synthase, partial [Planctomyces sp.]
PSSVPSLTPTPSGTWTGAPGEALSHSSPRPLPMGIRIIYEDADVIVVEKPVGLITAGLGVNVAEDSLLSVVKDHVRRQKPRGPGRQRVRDEADATGNAFLLRQRGRPYVGVIHRLDREASGLVVFSKSNTAFESLKEQLKLRKVHRLYLALVEGQVGPEGSAGTIQSLLRELPSGRVASIASDTFRGPPPRTQRPYRGRPADTDDEARPAVTHFRVARVGAGRTLLQVRLETGRKHQIRVHLSERGHPIVGDEKYGATINPIGRLGLHAVELGFTHPVTGKDVRFRSEPPVSFGASSLSRTAAPTAAPNSEDDASARTSATEQANQRAIAETAWENVAGWYDQLVEQDRNDHYDNVILPGVVRLLAPKPGQTILDVACGQGIVARRLMAEGARVVGVDASASLIESAQSRTPPKAPARFLVADARKLTAIDAEPASFDSACCVMGLTNIDPLAAVLKGIASLLRAGGNVVLVIQHPAFRITGQTSWGFDPKLGVQYRRVESYLTPSAKPIKMHPGAKPDVITTTFHRPLGAYVTALASSGLLVDAIEEWSGQRVSQPGPRAEAENRARREFPLFMAIRAVKNA